MDPDGLRPGPSAIGGPRGNAMTSSSAVRGTTAADDLKARLYTGGNAASAQMLPGTRGGAGRGRQSKKKSMRRGLGGGASSSGLLVPRTSLRGSRSTPALGGLAALGSSGGTGRGRIGRRNGSGTLLANNFLPGVSEVPAAATGAPTALGSGSRGHLSLPPENGSAAGELGPAGADTDALVQQAASGAATQGALGGKKRRTDQTFTQMLNLDRATLREFLRGDFLYLKADAGAVSVYDLHQVDHDEIVADKNSGKHTSYWTMSRAGLTQFFQSPEDATGPGTCLIGS